MSPLSALLRPVGWAYGRCRLWRRRQLQRVAKALPCPVISVGNLTCGGTGKTPTVEMIARELVRREVRPAILSRGYGHRYARVGTDDQAHGNDEFHVLRANLPTVSHYQDADRYTKGVEAVRDGAEVLILDDGFQHVKVQRDLNLALIDALSPFGNGLILPAGLLREPLDCLADADLFGLTRVDVVDPVRVSNLSGYLRRRFAGIPQIQLAARPMGWESLGGETLPPDALFGKRVLAFCGIGHPQAFRRQLVALDVEVVDMICFRDHHRYTENDQEKIVRRARERRVDEIVLTQKDAVKLPSDEVTSGWKQLRIEHEIVDGEEAYQAAIDRTLHGLNRT